MMRIIAATILMCAVFTYAADTVEDRVPEMDLVSTFAEDAQTEAADVKRGGFQPGYYKILTTGAHAGRSASQPANWGMSAWHAHGARRNSHSSWAAVHSGTHWPMIWKIAKSTRTPGTFTIKTTKFGPKGGKMPAGWGLSAWHAHGAVRNHASSRVAVHSGNYWLMDWKIQRSKRTRGAWTIQTWGGPPRGKQAKGWGLAAWQKHGGRRNHASSWLYVHSGNHWLMDWKFVRVSPRGNCTFRTCPGFVARPRNVFKKERHAKKAKKAKAAYHKERAQKKKKGYPFPDKKKKLVKKKKTRGYPFPTSEKSGKYHLSKVLGAAHVKAMKKSIHHAAGASKKHMHQSKMHAKAESRWSAVVAHLRAKAKKLNKAARGAAASMAASLRASAKKLAIDRAASLAKMRATDKAEAKMMKKSAAMQRKMRNVQQAMAKQGAAAKAATKRRLNDYKKEQASIARSIKSAQAQRQAIARSMAADARKLKADKKRIASVYKAKMARLSAQNKANQAKFDRRQARAQKYFAAKNKSNKAKYAAVKKALQKSEKRNKKRNKETQNKIARRSAQENASKTKADRAYQKQQKASAAALKAKRAATAERFAKKAAKAKRAFQADMREAAVKKSKAKNAARREKGAKAASERDTKAQERETKATTADDMSMKECALDGSECQTPDGKCHKTTPKGPFMATDMVSCSDMKPSEDQDSGLAWAGISPPLPLPPLPKPSKKCKALRKQCKATGCNLGLEGLKSKDAYARNPQTALVNLGCNGSKQDLMLYFDMAAACPPICRAGTQTSDGRNQDTHGDCIDGDTMAMFKMQITSMPVYKDMGTNGRFKANVGAGSICTMVKSLASGLGFAVPADTTELAQALPQDGEQSGILGASPSPAPCPSIAKDQAFSDTSEASGKILGRLGCGHADVYTSDEAKDGQNIVNPQTDMSNAPRPYSALESLVQVPETELVQNELTSESDEQVEIGGGAKPSKHAKAPPQIAHDQAFSETAEASGKILGNLQPDIKDNWTDDQDKSNSNSIVNPTFNQEESAPPMSTDAFIEEDKPSATDVLNKLSPA